MRLPPGRKRGPSPVPRADGRNPDPAVAAIDVPTNTRRALSGDAADPPAPRLRRPTHWAYARGRPGQPIAGGAATAGGNGAAAPVVDQNSL